MPGDILPAEMDNHKTALRELLQEDGGLNWSSSGLICQLVDLGVEDETSGFFPLRQSLDELNRIQDLGMPVISAQKLAVPIEVSCRTDQGF